MMDALTYSEKIEEILHRLDEIKGEYPEEIQEAFDNMKFAEDTFLYDSKLHIPNMGYLRKYLSNIMSTNKTDEYGLGFFNLKKFIIVNHLLGREMGTEVMIRFVSGLQKLLKDKGCVGRRGSDNFAIVFEKSQLNTIIDYLNGTEILYDEEKGESVTIKATGGIYLNLRENENMDDMFDKAHIAWLKVKDSPCDNIAIYNEELQNTYRHANWVESVFKHALDNEEFQVYYQPKVKLSDYTITGAEALCRWWHDGKMINPGEFIPILEQSNYICMLDFYMLEHVCRDMRKWIDRNLNVVRVSVNLSRRHLGDERLLEKILGIIDKYRIPPQYIEIELTETTTDVSFNDLKTIVNGLHANGVYTSVDDFGVGYSSLNLIRQVDWDVIKIDRSFLPNVSDKTSAQYLMFSHLLAMFRELGLKCVVEGVETIDQVRMLKENKCYIAQGFFFDRPLPLADFEKRITG